MKKIILVTAGISLSFGYSGPEMGLAYCDMLDDISCDASDLCSWDVEYGECITIDNYGDHKKSFGMGEYGFSKHFELPEYAKLGDMYSDFGYDKYPHEKFNYDNYGKLNFDDFDYGNKYNDDIHHDDKSSLNGFYESNKYYGSVYDDKYSDGGLGYGYGYPNDKKYGDSYDKFPEDRFDDMWDFEEDRFNKERFDYPEKFGNEDFHFDEKHYANYGKGGDHKLDFDDNYFDDKNHYDGDYHNGFGDYRKEVNFKQDYDDRRFDEQKDYGRKDYDFKY